MDFIKIGDLNQNLMLDKGKNLKSINLFSKYYDEYYEGKFIDLTFAIVKQNKVLGYAICCVLDTKLSLPDGGVIINLFEEDDKTIKQLYLETLDYLFFLAQQHCCQSITIKDCLKDGNLSFLGEQLFNQKFKGRLTFEMGREYKDFTSDSFYKTIRKSYKSLISWGRKNLAIVHVNNINYCPDNFNKFREFHHKIAGRKTRSNVTWQLQYDMVKSGCGELILAWYNDTLVAGSLFADYANTSIYFTGVYERELFNFGLSHFLLYSGICRSYKRGNTSKFSLGYFDTDISDPKWYNIQFFKKGFSEELRPVIFWSKEVI